MAIKDECGVVVVVAVEVLAGSVTQATNSPQRPVPPSISGGCLFIAPDVNGGLLPPAGEGRRCFIAGSAVAPGMVYYCDVSDGCVGRGSRGAIPLGQAVGKKGLAASPNIDLQ